MRKMNRFIPVALACAIFAAQPVQAATIIRDSDKQWRFIGWSWCNGRGLASPG